jgi:two-component system chemotaxis response regulator CheB
VQADGNGGGVVSFECRVSHKYTFETLVAAKALEVEAAVWAAINALEERAALLRKSAARARARGLSTAEVPERMIEQARESEQHAEAIRRTLLGSVMAVGAGAQGTGGDGGGLREGDVGPISA